VSQLFLIFFQISGVPGRFIDLTVQKYIQNFNEFWFILVHFSKAHKKGAEFDGMLLYFGPGTPTTETTSNPHLDVKGWALT